MLDTLRKVKRPSHQTMTSTWSFTYRHVEHVCGGDEKGDDKVGGKGEAGGGLGDEYIVCVCVCVARAVLYHHDVSCRSHRRFVSTDRVCMLPASVATDSRNITAIEPRGILAAIRLSRRECVGGSFASDVRDVRK